MSTQLPPGPDNASQKDAFQSPQGKHRGWSIPRRVTLHSGHCEIHLLRSAQGTELAPPCLVAKEISLFVSTSVQAWRLNPHRFRHCQRSYSMLLPPCRAGSAHMSLSTITHSSDTAEALICRRARYRRAAHLTQSHQHRNAGSPQRCCILCRTLCTAAGHITAVRTSKLCSRNITMQGNSNSSY